jgi:hypothetical protein
VYRDFLLGLKIVNTPEFPRSSNLSAIARKTNTDRTNEFESPNDVRLENMIWYEQTGVHWTRRIHVN